MSKESKQFDLEERLISFAVRIIKIVEPLPKTKVGNHIALHTLVFTLLTKLS